MRNMNEENVFSLYDSNIRELWYNGSIIISTITSIKYSDNIPILDI